MRDATFGQVSQIRTLPKKRASIEVERRVLQLIGWIDHLAVSFDRAFGYDGLRKTIIREAKSLEASDVKHYPFSNVSEFDIWLTKFAMQFKKQKQRS